MNDDAMKKDEFDLGDLPKFEANVDFEARLLADAMRARDADWQAEDVRVLAFGGAQTARGGGGNARIWASLAMAASLVFGFYLGFGHLGGVENGLSRIGLVENAAEDDLEINVYGELFAANDL